jgi:hypothetical protein
MLLRHEVLDVVNDFAVLLAQQIRLTAMSCAPTNRVARAGIRG